tara:strand:- start:468 stop:638 length:171 start_codon:yes stop_codon:yes gene_type:complete
MKQKLNDLLGVSFGVLFLIAYVGSLPLAIIFGDKWDVVLSLFIPAYGFVVMLFSVL